jgi:hypothetical protein
VRAPWLWTAAFYVAFVLSTTSFLEVNDSLFMDIHHLQLQLNNGTLLAHLLEELRRGTARCR